MLPNLLPILRARKYTFVHHTPGKQLFAPLAQLAEQVTLSHWVAGSIPARCISVSKARGAKWQRPPFCPYFLPLSMLSDKAVGHNLEVSFSRRIFAQSA